MNGASRRGGGSSSQGAEVHRTGLTPHIAPAAAVALPAIVHIILDEHIGVEGLPATNPETPAIKQELRSFYQSRGFAQQSRCQASDALRSPYQSQYPRDGLSRWATASIVLQATIGAFATWLMYSRMFLAKVKALFVRGDKAATTPDRRPQADSQQRGQTRNRRDRSRALRDRASAPAVRQLSLRMDVLAPSQCCAPMSMASYGWAIASSACSLSTRC